MNVPVNSEQIFHKEEPQAAGCCKETTNADWDEGIKGEPREVTHEGRRWAFSCRGRPRGRGTVVGIAVLSQQNRADRWTWTFPLLSVVQATFPEIRKHGLGGAVALSSKPPLWACLSPAAGCVSWVCNKVEGNSEEVQSLSETSRLGHMLGQCHALNFIFRCI